MGDVHGSMVSGSRAQSPSELGEQCRSRGAGVFQSVCLLTQESEQLRLITFQIYRSILTKVSKMTVVCPLRHQILNLLVLLVLHLQDANAHVAEVRSWTVEAGIRFSLEVNTERGEPLARAVTGLWNTEGTH